MIKNKIGIFLLAMLIGMVLVPSASAGTVNDNSDIVTKINYSSKSIVFNDTLNYYEIVTTNSTSFFNDVSDGHVTLKLLGQKFSIELEKLDIVSDDVKVITGSGDTVSISVPPKVCTYKGKVIGKADSNVLLTVADDVIIGQVDIDNKSYFIEQTSLKQNTKVVHLVYSSDAIKDRKYLEYNSDGGVYTEEAKKEMTNSSLNQTEFSAMLLSVPTVDIMACYDSEFRSNFSNPTAEIQNIIASTSTAFSAGNVNLNIKAYRYYTNIANDNVSAVLPAFKNVAKNDRDSTNSDIAFLFTGKEMTGGWVGNAYSYTGSSSQAYAVGQMVPAEGTYQASSAQRQILTSHEIGHIFGAKHEKAYDWYLVAQHCYTIMWSPFMGTSSTNCMKNEFSNLNNHGDSSHNNILFIVTNKGTIAGFQ